MDFNDRLLAALQGDRSSPLMEYKGRSYGRGEIARGGFKLLPETIVEVLRRRPAVLDAGVVGLPDHRLGEVPAAAIELKSGAAAPSEDGLQAFARRELAAPHAPVRFLIVGRLPRTTSLKIDLGAVRRLFVQLEPTA
jgi:acyl-CoA synthetase (AMP-forming)/AMP-acid ligase II